MVRKLTSALSLGIALLVGASPAGAVVMSITTAVGIQIATLTPVAIAGSGTMVVNGSGAPGHLTGLSLPAGLFATNGFVLPVTDPSAAPIKGVQVTAANGAGVFGGVGGSGSFGGTMPMLGSTKVCLFGTCSAAVANLNVPLDNVGVGGFAQVTAAVNLTVIGAPWTTGTVAIGTITMRGSAIPLSNTGATGGTATLVTPIFISTNIGASAVVPAFGILPIYFTPEPGTLVLLSMGVAGLLAYGRSRRR